MYWLRKGSQIASVAILLTMVCGIGCSTLPSSGIDPSGESVFSGPPPSNPFPCLGGTSSSSTYSAPFAPAFGTSPNAAPQIGRSSGPKLLPQPLLGESYDGYPTGRLQWDNTGIVVTPGRTVAPVGSQVIIIAGVVAPDKYLSMNERVEWSLTSGSVGQFVEVEPDSWTDLFLLDFTLPRKMSPLEAVTSTSRANLNLNRGTPVTSDDIKIRRGETWVAVSSPVEGTSFVNVLAPSVHAWNARERTAMIHWVDVEWQFPAPSFGPAGGHQTLTTKLSRHSDHRPLSGWRVRYTITGGPAAGFTPDGAKVTEVVTNQNGEAIVELAEQLVAPGTNQISIEIVRPDGVGSGGMRGIEGSAITVGQGSTMVTWSAPELAITKTGPQAVGIGAMMTYQINVTNPGDLPTDDVRIVDEVPLGAEYIDSTPPAQQVGSSLRWSIGRLAPREMRTVQVRLRATQSGSMASCAEATAIGGLSARGCVTTQVGSPKLEVKIAGPPAARVGDIVTFEILVLNRSQVSATNLTIEDRFDEGLASEIPGAMESRKISKKLQDIQPGQTSRMTLNFRTTRTGRLCNEVTVVDSSGNSTSARGCVDVTPATPASTDTSTDINRPVAPDLSGGNRPPPREGGRSEVRIEKTGPPQVAVGEEALFTIEVKNMGETELTNLEIVDSYDPQLQPSLLTRGYKLSPDGRSVSWKLPSILPGKSIPYQIKCKASGPTNRVSNRARVTTNQGVEDTSEAYITITEPAAAGTGPGAGTGFGGTGYPPNQPGGSGFPQQGNLVVTVNDDRDMVESGKQFNYEILITNKGNLPDQNVTLTVDVSPELIPMRIGTGGVSEPNIVGQRVEFPPIPEIRPDETLPYRVRVQARTPGVAKVTATVSSQRVPKVESTEDTTINPAQ